LAEAGVAGIRGVYRRLCPNCGGPVGEDRLAAGLPCEACLPRPPRRGGIEAVARALRGRGRLLGLHWLWSLEREYREFEEYFEGKTGSRPWSAQRSWARRLLAGESFAIIAPTGVGKSTLLSVYAAFRVERSGWRILYLVPTENLVRQVASRLQGLLEGYRVSFYYSSMPRRLREEALSSLAPEGPGVTVVTTGLLSRRFGELARSGRFDLVVVDDVDSLLRASRNIDRVLQLLGFPESLVEAAARLVEAKLRYYRLSAAGAPEERLARLEEEIAELEAAVRAYYPESHGQLVIASATGRPRGHRHLVFKELLGFEVGGGSDYLRNVVDSYTVTGSIEEGVADLVERLGGGGIVFVSQALGREEARRLASLLKERGVRAGLVLSGGRRRIEEFERGELDVLVGVASRYGGLVRGLDLPERVRYAVFAGTPGMRMSLGEALLNPRRLLRLLDYAASRGEEWAGEGYRRLARLLDRLPDPGLVALAAKGRLRAEGLLAEAAGAAAELAARLEPWLVEEARAGGGVVRVGGLVVEADGFIFVPDAPTYLQASGRTSRLLRGSMTRGLSVIVDVDGAYVEALWERLRWMAKAEFRRLEDLDLEEVMREVDESRRGGGRRVQVKTVLLLVESPTKARSIAWFWGRPGRRRIGRVAVYEASVADEESGTVYIMQVAATRGHMLDLATDEADSRHGVRVGDGVYEPVYETIKRCVDCGHQFTSSDTVCPRCGSPRVLDSREVLEAIRRLATEVDEVIVATDPDREGEKIAWDAMLAVKPYNPNVKRARFHEVTPAAVLEALRSAGEFDRRLVRSQEARRIVDRWIGFTLSLHLQALHGKPWLGAGRVQTPLLGWIIERYEAWRSSRGYAVAARLRGGGLLRVFAPGREEARRAAEAEAVEVVSVEEWWEEYRPPPPFTTDSLILEASRRLGLSAQATMRLAQDLFESGLITYHRTDSTRVSPAGMAIAREYLARLGLAGEYRPRQWGEGGAHEAIRPTRPMDAGDVEKAVLDGSLRLPIRLTRLHLRLYDLIFRRFIASQMAPGRVKRARATVRLGPVETVVEGAVEAVGGAATLYPPRLDRALAEIAAAGPGGRVPVEEARVVKASRERLATSGDAVQWMKSVGIGRPSTYAKAIEANRRHGYIVESKRRHYLIPTKMGFTVYTYLSTAFKPLVSVETSRELEEMLDRVERGEESPVTVIEGAWSLIEELLTAASRGEAAGEAGAGAV